MIQFHVEINCYFLHYHETCHIYLLIISHSSLKTKNDKNFCIDWWIDGFMLMRISQCILWMTRNLIRFSTIRDTSTQCLFQAEWHEECRWHNVAFSPIYFAFRHYFFALSKDLHHCGSCLWWKWRAEKIRSVSQLWAPSSYKWNRKMRIKIFFWLKRMRSMKCAEEEEKHNQNHSELFTSTPTNISNFIVQKKLDVFLLYVERGHCWVINSFEVIYCNDWTMKFYTFEEVEVLNFLISETQKVYKHLVINFY